MPDQSVDVDEARTVGVAVPPSSKADYLEAASQLQPGYVATVDGTDPSIGWTSQHLNGEREMAGDGEAKVTAFVEPGDSLPGQVYLPSQLPDPQAAITAGMAPVKVPEHLITEDEDHIQGPEPLERLGLELRDRLRARVVRHRKGVADPDSIEDDAPAEEPSAPPAPPKGAGNGPVPPAPASAPPAP